MVANGRRASRWGAYAALGVALALGLAPQAVAQTNDAQPQAQSANAERGQGNAGTVTGPAPSATNQTSCTSDQCATKHGTLSVQDHIWRFIWRLGRRPIAVFTLLLFVVGGIQFELGRRTERRQLRAYVTAFPNFIYSFDGENYFWFTAQLRNDGLTPDFNVSHKMGIELAPYPIPIEIYLPNPGGTSSPPMVLFPRDSFEATYTNNRLFTTEEISDIKEASVAIVLNVVVSYADILGKSTGLNSVLTWERTLTL